ncbi:hypothetical protein IEQ34_016523 [Dendrobium chrysotoxum]|uniref:Uncharacterized protein n=1 Tax=Dendrobium chrysotoxum TaxID=161865 RepID=A0AAV7GFC1_DENCH|nr:hypothetical protein IEQ34_016523 [Dendrobium chrysotoxum]
MAMARREPKLRRRAWSRTSREGEELIRKREGSTLRRSRGRRPLDFRSCRRLTDFGEAAPSGKTSRT